LLYQILPALYLAHTFVKRHSRPAKGMVPKHAMGIGMGCDLERSDPAKERAIGIALSFQELAQDKKRGGKTKLLVNQLSLLSSSAQHQQRNDQTAAQLLYHLWTGPPKKGRPCLV
jgi:hypothetical protein